MAHKKEVVLKYLCYLDDIEIDEPAGLADLEISIARDEKLHGMTFEASTSPLQFTGTAYLYLKNKKQTEGVKAKVIFRAMVACDNYDYEELLSGRLNFGKYKESCGDVCNISIPWEQDSCAVVFNARRDQKVDMDGMFGVDGVTPMNNYAGLAVETELPAHELRVAADGSVAEEGDVIDLSIFPPTDTNDFTLRPIYAIERSANINETQLNPSVFAASDNGLNDSVISPILLLDEVIDCFDDDFNYTIRMKGSYNFNYFSPLGDDNITVLRLIVGKGEYPSPFTILHSQDLPFSPNSAVGAFDYTFTGTTPLNQGDGFYAYLRMTGTNVGIGGTVLTGSVTFDKETLADIEGVRSCPATQAELYMVHEALSRAAETITNGCVRAKSSYYGRKDSEPFSFPNDGCGGLRSVTSGLKIRRAPEDKFFASVKDLVEGLQAIDNIGMEIKDDQDIAGRSLMIIEDLPYFYRDVELLRHNAIPKATTDTEETKFYSKVNIGYKKWEVEAVNGLDEFNSNRQYNTSIDTIDSTLEQTSVLVAGSYPIEITREQSFADSGAADTKYDNEVFIICLERSTYPYGLLKVELGNITNPQNIFSPQTIYNYRISPLRNLMRWYKSIAAGFANLSSSENKLFFSSGTGNLVASGIMTDEDCRMESVEIQENQNIFVTQFRSSNDYTPLWKNETITYDYAMSLAEYKTLKGGPYGYISAQCGEDGEWLKYWIKEIKYRINKGMATFILRRKYE